MSDSKYSVITSDVIKSFDCIFIREVINLRYCLFKDVTDDRDLRRTNLKSFVSIGLFVFVLFLLHNNITLENHCTRTAVIAWWLQSTSEQNSVHVPSC